MRAIVIDTYNYNIFEVDIGNYKDYYTYLKCDTFDAVTNEHGDISAFVDDDGLLKKNFLVDILPLGFPQYYAGNIVLTGGVDSEGETLPLPSYISVEDIANIAKIVGETR